MIEIDREIAQDFARAIGLEWLETNGLGGWAGTTVAGAHSRRHHGLLVAATEPPARRTVLLSKLDEALHVGGESFELSCNQFPGAIVPRGFEHLTAFRKDLFPVFELEAGGVRLRKTVAAVDGENSTLVLYEIVEAPGPFILSLRPFLAARDRQALTAANSAISQETPFEGWTLRLRPYPDGPEVFLQVPGADFRANPQWWYRFEYEVDRRRGLDFQEDLWTPGVFGRELNAGDRLGIVISTQDPAGHDAFALLEKERKRREEILKAVPVQDDLARYLALAADSFVVRRGSNRRAVIAGYPGQEERSRDTMIALPGLCLVTGRHGDAKTILRAFVKSLSPEPPLIDASLWFFVASWRYLQATGDEAFVRETLLPALRKVKAERTDSWRGISRSVRSGSTPFRSSPMSKHGWEIRRRPSGWRKRRSGPRRASSRLFGTRSAPSRSSLSACPSRCCPSRRRHVGWRRSRKRCRRERICSAPISRPWCASTARPAARRGSPPSRR